MQVVKPMSQLHSTSLGYGWRYVTASQAGRQESCISSLTVQCKTPREKRLHTDKISAINL